MRRRDLVLGAAAAAEAGALAKMVEGMQDRMAEILKTTGGDPRYSGKGSEGDKFAM